ncbi:hypothetical protein H6F51_18175 [Cyanobacteria bacterium FACHB-DQ100]|nr:hypothetical protein [Cyanobacteria bacterium FACHB-DQ100]
MYEELKLEAAAQGVDVSEYIRRILRNREKPSFEGVEKGLAAQPSKPAKKTVKLDTSIADNYFNYVLESTAHMILEEDLQQIDELLKREFEEETGENGRKWICFHALEKLVSQICERDPRTSGGVGNWESNLIRIYAHRRGIDWVEVGARMGFRKEVDKRRGLIVKEYLT